MRHRVLIADDSKSIQALLTRMLQQEDDIEVVGCAQNGEDAIEMADELKPDVVIMDLLMPVMTGIAATKILSDKFPSIKIIGHSMSSRSMLVKGILGAGASAFIVKDQSPDALLTAIRKTGKPKEAAFLSLE